jgi:hypothetical protein
MTIHDRVPAPQEGSNFPQSFDVVLGGIPLQKLIKLTQIEVLTGEGKYKIPAIVTGQLAVNRDPRAEKWVITHVKSGRRIVDRKRSIQFDTEFSVFGALYAALTLEKLDFSWVTQGGKLNTKKAPDGFRDRISEILQEARNWEVNALATSLEPIQGGENEATE